jgi:GNAT superfamily N-acetyltransferase
VSTGVEVSVLDAPLADTALDQLADVLVDCVEGGASVSFMSPFPHAEALAFFRRVAASVASGDTVLLAARLDGRIVGTVQLGLDTPANQPHRADIKKTLVHRSARSRGIGAALMARVEQERGAAAAGCWCWTPYPARTGTASTSAPAGRRRGSSRTTRCFPMAGLAIPR